MREGLAQGFPRHVKELQGFGYGAGAVVEALGWGERVGDEDDAVWNAVWDAAWGCVEVEAGQDFAAERAFERGEAEGCALVALEQEANEMVAEGAEAVVEEEGTGFDLGMLGFGHFGDGAGDGVGRCAETFILDGCL